MNLKKLVFSFVIFEDPMLRRNAVLRMFWGGEKNPSVECPIGDLLRRI